MMKVVDCHIMESKVQKFFASEWTSSKNILTSFRIFWFRAIKKWLFQVFRANFLSPKSTNLSKSCHLFKILNLELFYLSHFQLKSFLKKISLVILCPIFDGSQSRSHAQYQKILWKCSNLLKSTCHTMKFLNFH